MTPRSGRPPSRSLRGIPMLSLNASLLTSPSSSSPVADDSSAAGLAEKGLDEETLPCSAADGSVAEEAAAAAAAAEMEEQRELIESQGKRIEELTRKIQSLEESKNQLLTSNESFSRNLEKLTEDKTRLDENLRETEAANLDLQTRFETLRRDLAEKEESLRIARSEAEDYRLMEAQSARRMTELKTEHSTIMDGKENQLEEFEAKTLQLESNLKALADEREEALKVVAEREDVIVRLEDEIRLGRSSHQTLESELEGAKSKEKELVSLAAQLEADLEKVTEKNTRLSQELSSRGDQMESRLAEALSGKEEAEDRVRSLSDRLDNLQAEWKSLKADLTSTRESLARSERGAHDLKTVLGQVQEHAAQLEDTLKTKESQLTELRGDKDKLQKELEEKSASVERALREADKVDAQLEEARKALKTEKESHEFDVDNLTEDNAELQDLVNELKGKKEAAEAAAAEAEAEVAEGAAQRSVMMAQLEALEAKRREEEEAKAGQVDTASPSRSDALLQENEELVSRQNELLRQMEIYETGRREREEELTQLKSRMEKSESDSLLLHQIRAKYDSLQTELEYARQQSSADAATLVAMTTRLDDADAEKRLLSDRCEELRSQAEEDKTSIRAKKEAMEKEVDDMQRQRSAWAREAEQAAQDKEKLNFLLTFEKAAKDQISYWKEEYEKVQKENGLLMGHHNHKQKINHIVDLKNQLTSQKQENAKLKTDLELLKKKYDATKLKENRPPIHTQ